MHHPTDRITHTTAFVAPVVEHWLEREIDLGRKEEEGNVLFNDMFAFWCDFVGFQLFSYRNKIGK